MQIRLSNTITDEPQNMSATYLDSHFPDGWITLQPGARTQIEGKNSGLGSFDVYGQAIINGKLTDFNADNPDIGYPSIGHNWWTKPGCR